MKIRAIHTQSAGPLGTNVFDLKDKWTGEIAPNTLFCGPNGSGKSSVLRAVAMLWSAFGKWMHTRSALPKYSAEREWLQRWGGLAVVLEETPFSAPPIALVFGEQPFLDHLQKERPELVLVGESVLRTGKPGNPARKLLFPSEAPWLTAWTEARQMMLVSVEKTDAPNMLFLDAEERRWVTPKRGLGEMKPENLQQRWLTQYQVSESWEGQLEASLLAMKSAALHRFHDLIKDMNSFLSGKKILPDVRLGENRLKVRISGTGVTHNLDELSAGEHQVLIQLYLISRWLEKGGVAMIDEPDLYLHPSLLAGFLSQVERMVKERDGQLLLTSHVPEVWNRYDAIGKRVLLEVAQ
jgi:predicted ATPase